LIKNIVNLKITHTFDKNCMYTGLNWSSSYVTV